MPADTVLLAAHGLGCTVEGRELWRDVDLLVVAGDCWAVAGPSGSGKTMLLRTLAGLAPSQAGKIHLCGKPMQAWWPPMYRARVMYVAQRPALPEGTVENALAATFKLRVHREKRFAVDAARRQLAAVDLGPAFLEQETAGLSGGETQIVGVLRALLACPDVLLLDEPTASLDHDRTQRLEMLVGHWLQDAPDRACIWTTHDDAQRARVASHTLTLAPSA